VRHVAVQHHHAHIVGVLAEHRLEGPVIGLSFDGTGYGTDGAVWGGEVLVAAAGRFERAAHLAYVPMPGSARAIHEPWRMAASYLAAALGDGWDRPDLPLFTVADREKLALAVRMARAGVNSPPTSSLGRLFDGVAALCGLRGEVRFEGQAAMELEMTADPDVDSGYPWEPPAAGRGAIDTAPLIRAVAADLAAGVPVPVVAGRFHRSVVALFTGVCRELRAATGLRRVALSGGVFQNALLLEGLPHALARQGLETIVGRQTPANDGGLALGQAAVAAARHPEGAR